MCKPHWNQYTSALRKAALARKAQAEQGKGPIAAYKERQARGVKREAEGKGPIAAYKERAAKGSVIDRLSRAANAAGGTVTITPVGTCSKTVGKRTCVAGAEGHAGPHDWPKTATAKAPRRSKVEHPMAHIPPAGPKPARKPKAPKLEPARVQDARAVLAAIDAMPGPESVKAMGTDEAQTALDVVNASRGFGGHEDTFESDVRAILAEA